MAPALSARGRQRSSRRRDDASGDDARRHRGRRASRRRALSASRRQTDAPAARRSADSDHRGRVRRSGVRLGLREDHARPRLQRLRGRQAARPAADQHLRRERSAQRRSAGSRIAAWIASRRASASSRTSRRSACSRRSSRTRCTVPRGDRSGAVLEPWLTDQWYVRIAPLAEPAIKAVEDGRTRFVPENWSKDILPVDAQHPGLVHQPAAVVGSPDSGVVRRAAATSTSRARKRSAGAGAREARARRDS